MALLLVTIDFLASDFIADVELQAFIKAAEQEGLVILWVAVGASAYEESMLRDYQAANDPEHPLNSLTKADQEKTLVDIGKQVKLALA